MSFEKMLEFGKTGESHLSKFFQRSGFAVLPVYEIEQKQYKGPNVFTGAGDYVAPDMLCFSNRATFEGDRNFFIEAKTKSAFSWHRKTEQFNTGISAYHFTQYLSLQDASPFPIWLMFLQLDGPPAKDSPQGPNGLYGGTLNRLRRCVHHTYPHDIDPTQCHDKSAMVYWAEDVLTRFADLECVLAGEYRPSGPDQRKLL